MQFERSPRPRVGARRADRAADPTADTADAPVDLAADLAADLERDFWGGATWDEQPAHATRARARRGTPRPAGSRQHTQTQPVTLAHRSEPDAGVRPPRVTGQPVDPLLRRVGLLTIATALVIPVAIAARSDDSPATTLRTTPAVAAPAEPTEAAAGSTTITLVDTSGSVGISSTGDASGDPSTAAAESSEATVEPTAAATDAPTTRAPDTVASHPVAAFASQVATTPAPTAAPTTAAPATAAPTIATVAATVAPTAAPTTSIDPTAAHAAAVAACTNTYAIQPGDYWIMLAKRAGVSLADLLDVNVATVDTPLYAGRKICLPSGISMPVVTAPATTDAPATTAAPKPTSTTAAPTTTPATTTPATTTPRSTTTTEPAPPPPANTYSAAEVEAIIREVWPDDLEDEALRIATRESNLVPTVRNACCFGLFQIYYSVHKSWLASQGVTSAAQLYDPRVNTTVAYAMYLNAGGWGPWT